MVYLYSTIQWLLSSLGELPYEGLLPVVEIPVESFTVRRSIRAVPQDNHMSHLQGITPASGIPFHARGQVGSRQKAAIYLAGG